MKFKNEDLKTFKVIEQIGSEDTFYLDDDNIICDIKKGFKVKKSFMFGHSFIHSMKNYFRFMKKGQKLIIKNYGIYYIECME